MTYTQRLCEALPLAIQNLKQAHQHLSRLSYGTHTESDIRKTENRLRHVLEGLLLDFPENTTERDNAIAELLCENEEWMLVGQLRARFRATSQKTFNSHVQRMYWKGLLCRYRVGSGGQMIYYGRPEWVDKEGNAIETGRLPGTSGHVEVAIP